METVIRLLTFKCYDCRPCFAFMFNVILVNKYVSATVICYVSVVLDWHLAHLETIMRSRAFGLYGSASYIAFMSNVASEAG